VFNANLVSQDGVKFWYGDIDLTEDMDNLLGLASLAQQDFYILSEMDARFGNEKELTKKNLLDVAIVTIRSDCTYIVNPQYTLCHVIVIVNGKLMRKLEATGSPDYESRGFEIDKDTIINSINIGGVLRKLEKDVLLIGLSANPLNRIYEYLKDKAGIELRAVTQVVVNEKLGTEIHSLFKQFLLTNKEKLYLTDGYQMKKALTWAWFDSGPVETSSRWAEDYTVYIRAGEVHEEISKTEKVPFELDYSLPFEEQELSDLGYYNGYWEDDESEKQFRAHSLAVLRPTSSESNKKTTCLKAFKYSISFAI